MQAPNYAFATMQYKLCCLCEILAIAVIAQSRFEAMHVCIAFLFIFLPLIFVTFLTLSIFSTIESNEPFKIDLCYQFDFNLWQPELGTES